jgi:uncharacterized membrane protein YbhN (UPF0104 family)
VLTGLAGAIAVCALLAYVLADNRAEFGTALASAPLWILAVATGLQLLALVSRTESWHVCVAAAGGTVGRRGLYRAASFGYVGSQLNSQIGAAARIGALRRTAPQESPRVPALIAAEVPILAVEGALAALASFTLVAPLGLPWWLPLIALAVVGLVSAALRQLALRKGRELWRGLAVLRSFAGGSRVVGFVLVAVVAQILRNWILLRAVGVDASLLDATAVLIAVVTLGQLPVGPTVGAAAAVLILGHDGVAAAAAGGLLLTVTGTIGGLCFVVWAGVDHVMSKARLVRRRPAPRPESSAG